MVGYGEEGRDSPKLLFVNLSHRYSVQRQRRYPTTLSGIGVGFSVEFIPRRWGVIVEGGMRFHNLLIQLGIVCGTLARSAGLNWLFIIALARLTHTDV